MSLLVSVRDHSMKEYLLKSILGERKLVLQSAQLVRVEKKVRCQTEDEATHVSYSRKL